MEGVSRTSDTLFSGLGENIFIELSGKQMRQGLKKSGIFLLEGIRTVAASPFPVHIAEVPQRVFLAKGIEDAFHKRGIHSQCL